MLNNLSDQQFGGHQTAANTSHKSANGQSGPTKGGTTTLITVKGDAPTLSTRSS